MNGLLLVIVDNEELQDPAISAAVQTMTRMSGFLVRCENPHFLAEALDPDAVQAVTTAQHMAKVTQAARTTLFKMGKEIRVGALLTGEVDPGALMAAAAPQPTTDAQGVPLLSFLKPPPTAGPTHPIVAGTLAGDGIQPLEPATQPMVPPVDLNPVTDPEAALFDVATLPNVSAAVAAQMKQPTRGWTTVRVLRSLTKADITALEGVGDRIADKILADLATHLPPLALSASRITEQVRAALATPAVPAAS